MKMLKPRKTVSRMKNEIMKVVQKQKSWNVNFYMFTVPRLYGDRIPTRVLTPSNKKVQRKIVIYHNFFRTRVTPTAANMLVMVSCFLVQVIFSYR